MARQFGEKAWDSSRLVSAAVVVVAVFAVALLLLRLRYGVDLNDESYYAAGSYRFALGMRPLLDDLGPHQFASWLMMPVVWTWLRVQGGGHPYDFGKG